MSEYADVLERLGRPPRVIPQLAAAFRKHRRARSRDIVVGIAHALLYVALTILGAVYLL